MTNKNKMIVDKTDRVFAERNREEANIHKTPNRERVPLHKQRFINALERPGYYRKFVLEDRQEIQKHILAGYSVVGVDALDVDDTMKQVMSVDGTARIQINKRPDAAIKYAVLMEIPLEHYQEDYNEEQKINDAQMAAIDPTKGKVANVDYGHLRRVKLQQQ